MEMTLLQLIWFSLFVILLTGYAILDGFDLGVGILHLFSKEDEERRLMLNSIGPVWDGNEVWLVTAGGALFAGFPPIYATITSGFYLPVMALLAALIFRAVAIEVRSKSPRIWWRWTWDLLFALASFLIAFILGVVMGNLIQGVPLTGDGEFDGTLEHIFTPYAILVGFMTVSLFTMHGSIYLLMKTEGAFHDYLRKFVNPSIIIFILFFSVTTVATLIYFPHMVVIFKHRPYLFGVVLLAILTTANIPREISQGRDWRAFVSSAFTIICLMTIYGIGTYPNVVRNTIDPDNGSLTIYNSSSSTLTLEVLLLMAIIGIPLVIAYTTCVYWIFRGKVRLDDHSY